MDYERTAATAGGGHKERPAGIMPVSCKLHKANRITHFSAMIEAEAFQRNLAHVGEFSAIQRNGCIQRISRAFGAFGARSEWP